MGKIGDVKIYRKSRCSCANEIESSTYLSMSALYLANPIVISTQAQRLMKYARGKKQRIRSSPVAAYLIQSGNARVNVYDRSVYGL